MYWGSHVTNDLTDDIFWKQGTRMPWFNTRLGHLNKKEYTSYICVIYLIYYIYIVYILYVYYISYILHIFVMSKVCVI